ncbi:carbohydrate kinase [Paucisalibacillus sp. EB02]|uniref:carbohydrate kinase family protein n=1 Tax=Paucisalibacillus sp. EB02 TaxID=1347087 RepID=UPI0004B69B2D|nr:carbohydrate kinase [Paucisalibacillus sp. EB02]
MIDVTALGEILVDFTPQGFNEDGNPSFVANPGGAPGNVMAGLSCLGKKSAFMGSVGSDQFGKMLRDTLKDKGINVEGMVDVQIPTTLAFVHIAEEGERSFSFYRKPGADMMLTKDDLKLNLISNSRIFHVGSISLTDEPVRVATLTALKYAKDHGVAVSFDPNLRPALWESLSDAKKWILEIMPFADIVKLSEEELEFLTGANDIQVGVEKLTKQYDIPLLFVTLGAKGSYCFANGESLMVPGTTVYAIDTTGCGDAFLAGALYQILEMNVLGKELTKKELRSILEFGNAMGGYVATKNGAIPAMPTLEQLQDFFKSKSE